MVETIVQDLLNAAKLLSDKCTKQIPKLLKHKDVAHVTNPLDYAWELHEQFITKWAGCGAKTLLLGMNPGPYGMAQTGVPFGATKMATDVLGMEPVELQTPSGAHPKRPIQGPSMERQEVSGTRFWTFMVEHFGSIELTFSNIFVVNHCPLLILGETGRNITPVDIPKSIINPILDLCDQHLKSVVDIMGIERIVGVGNYAKKRAKTIVPELDIDAMWHPSPASPLANRNGGADWRANVASKLPLP